MTKTDPWEMFRALNPYLDVPGDETPDEELLARIKNEPRSAVALHSSKRRLWMVGGGVAVVALATAAFAVLRTAPATEPTAITCAATDDPKGDAVGLAGAPDPVAACTELWRDGTLGSDTVPPLAACVNNAGAVIVLPGGASAVCSNAGFDLLDLNGGNADIIDVLELEERLIDRFLTNCFSQDDALSEVRNILDDNGFTDWTVTLAEDFPDGLNCAGIGVDASAQDVTVAGARPN